MGIYKVCDIRGKFGSEISTWHASRLGQAIVTQKKPDKILVAGDGRLSTPVLKSALMESIIRSGGDVIDIGMVPIPLFYFARNYFNIKVGVMVTASHMPAIDNGFKITLGSMPVTGDEIKSLADWMEGDFNPKVTRPGKYYQKNLMSDYVNLVSAHIPNLSGLKIVVDCSHGMTGLVAHQIWEKSGAEVIYLFDNIDGNFPDHNPNPQDARNLKMLQESVLKNNADLGVMYDGDGDRVAFVDENGNPVSNDKVIVIFIREILRSGKETIVFDQKCSRIVPDTIHQFKGKPVMEISGHTYIKRSFLKFNAAYAGELSGHHFFKDLNGDDGIGASLIFANIIKKSKQSLSKITDAIPVYPITPDIRIPMQPADVQQLILDLESKFQGKATLKRTDGLRIESDSSWGLVRPSINEPVVTLRFEGINRPALTQMINQVETASGLLSGKLSGYLDKVN
ncbi:MAG: phosphomannomutase/phosphoglucomutase [Anaerolineae bacterium]|nr:phosphomannomutase/phosphoglucomutase [Anaerolineae bacterium]